MFPVDCIQSLMSDDSYDLAPTPRRVLTDDVVDSIRDAILSGKIRPRRAADRGGSGARSLKVSRGPVRQAIFRLQQEGLVVHEPHRGATVGEVSEDDVAEIYSLRLALERLAIEQASRKATAAELAEIEAVLAALSRDCRAGQGDAAAGGRARHRFPRRHLSRGGQLAALPRLGRRCARS